MRQSGISPREIVDGLGREVDCQPLKKDVFNISLANYASGAPEPEERTVACMNETRNP